MHSPRKKHCSTWYLLNWLKKQQEPETDRRFGQEAQAALDSAEAPDAATRPGTMYRAKLPLADLKPGECGDVRRLLGSTQARLRLLEMGLTPGTHVKMVRAAAFGGPVEVLVRGYQLSLRREEAASVWLDDEGP